MKAIIANWRNERGFTFQFIAELLTVSVGHAQNIMAGRLEANEVTTRKGKEIDNLLHLIDGNPSDTILLKYELSQLTGLEMDEIEKGKEKAVRKIDREAFKGLPEEPKSLRKVTLRTLENLRENGYRSVFRPNISYDPKEVDAEIARKKFNAKRKKEIWQEKMALRV